MRIPNFNGGQTWIAWNKMYCYDLERKINSLYTYWMYFNPDYLIFNSPSREDKSWSNEKMISLGYQMDDSTNNKSYFCAGKLQWRQGFYNNSQFGDGKIVIGVQELNITNTDINSINTTYSNVKIKDHSIIINSKVFYSYIVDKHIPEDGKINIKKYPGFTLKEVLYSNNTSWLTNQGNQLQNNDDHYVYGVDSNVSSVVSFHVNEDYINFPAGYVCIKNTNKKFLSREDLLILPIGNGGFYNLTPSSTSINASFQRNELNNFSNNTTISLASNVRYVNLKFIQLNKDNNISKTIFNEDTKTHETTIGDREGNIWTGGEDLIPIFTDNNHEEIILDVSIKHLSDVVEYRNLSKLQITSKIDAPKFNVNIDLF